MFNYFNIGYDPQVALHFHSLRNERPDLFPSRLINQLWYGFFGLKSVLMDKVHNLNEVCSLEIDGQEISIPEETKTIVFLNFSCYQAGVNIWGSDEQGSEPSPDDKILEVIGIGSCFHEALIRLSLAPGTRLGRGSSIKLQISKPVALSSACDGEPSKQFPSIITIEHKGKIKVINKL